MRRSPAPHPLLQNPPEERSASPLNRHRHSDSLLRPLAALQQLQRLGLAIPEQHLRSVNPHSASHLSLRRPLVLQASPRPQLSDSPHNPHRLSVNPHLLVRHLPSDSLQSQHLGRLRLVRRLLQLRHSGSPPLVRSPHSQPLASQLSVLHLNPHQRSARHLRSVRAQHSVNHLLLDSLQPSGSPQSLRLDRQLSGRHQHSPLPALGHSALQRLKHQPLDNPRRRRHSDRPLNQHSDRALLGRLRLSVKMLVLSVP